MDKMTILSDLKGKIQDQYPDSLKSVILFGSQAKATNTGFSDFDVLILMDKDYTWRDENKILDICYDIDLKYNILIDAHLLSTKELNTLRGRQPLFMNALNYGIYA